MTFKPCLAWEIALICIYVLCVLSHFSQFWFFMILWAIARQAPLSTGFSRQECWSGLPCPAPGDLPSPGIKPASPAVPALQAFSLLLSHQRSPICFRRWCLNFGSRVIFYLKTGKFKIIASHANPSLSSVGNRGKYIFVFDLNQHQKFSIFKKVHHLMFLFSKFHAYYFLNTLNFGKIQS